MSLMKWKPTQHDPFKDLFEADFPFGGLSLFPVWEGNNQAGVRAPAIDVTEDKSHVTVKADLPGVEKKDIQVNVDGTVLTIRAERKHEEEKKEQGYKRYERAYGIFQRSLDIGTNTDAEKIKAKYKDGVLELVIPKKEATQMKQIQIDG